MHANLVKDFKSYDIIKNSSVKGIGCSSTVIPAEKFKETFGLPAIIEAMRSLMINKKLGVYIIFSNYMVEDEFNRDMMLFTDKSILDFKESKI